MNNSHVSTKKSKGVKNKVIINFFCPRSTSSDNKSQKCLLGRIQRFKTFSQWARLLRLFGNGTLQSALQGSKQGVSVPLGQFSLLGCCSNGERIYGWFQINVFSLDVERKIDERSIRALVPSMFQSSNVDFAASSRNATPFLKWAGTLRDEPKRL